ncbi:ER 25 kDa transmembrane protein [Yamadazyma tenuis]|nr:ER 25 kDa transmembrane protein [Yamadazyma tenuis]
MVLPLPHVFRRRIVSLIDVLRSSSNFKIGVGFYSLILAMQFADCLQRLQKLDYMKTPYFTMSNIPGGPVGLTNEQLASKFYSQRNLYISGAVLYLELAIYTVGTILKKLVLKEDRLRATNLTQKFGSEQEEEAKYKQLLTVKDQEIAKVKAELETST